MEMKDKTYSKKIFWVNKLDDALDNKLSQSLNRDLNLFKDEDHYDSFISRSEMMKIKRFRSKKLLEQSRSGVNRDYYDIISNFSDKEKKVNARRELIKDKYTTDENLLKVLKNRISAQQSREKKKLIFDKVMTENITLERKIFSLNDEIIKLNTEIEQIKSKFQSLCHDCSSLMKDNKNENVKND